MHLAVESTCLGGLLPLLEDPPNFMLLHSILLCSVLYSEHSNLSGLWKLV